MFSALRCVTHQGKSMKNGKETFGYKEINSHFSPEEEETQCFCTPSTKEKAKYNILKFSYKKKKGNLDYIQTKALHATPGNTNKKLKKPKAI